MSIVVSNHLEIVNNPTNTSPSKVQYSFSKEPRFVKNYKLYNSNKNPQIQYYEGQQYEKLTSMNTLNGKFNNASRLKDIFVEINRQHVYNPDPFRYTIQS